MNKIELLDHQINDYNTICEEFQNKKMLLYITATGNGKSYITGKYIQDNKLKALVFTPTKAIGKQWSDLIDCDTVTYQKFYRLKNDQLDKISSEYDFFIVDEAHHVGAPIWRKNIEYLKNISGEKRILGLTANPNRYNDTNTDISEEIFESNIIEGKNLSESIDAGILPRFDFITAFYTKPSEINSWVFKKLSDEKRKRYDMLIRKLNIEINDIKLKEIIFNHLPRDTRKIVVFVPDIKSIDETRIFLQNVFIDMDINIYDISSSKTQKRNFEIINKFENSESHISILITVDMLNEGRHIKGVNTIFMFRRTGSPQIYLQQIGRALDSSNKTSKIVIYDFVRNKDNIDFEYLSSFESSDCDTNKTRNTKISDQCIKYSYIDDCVNILNEIDYLFKPQRKWNKNELEILYKYYPTEGSDVFKRLPRRCESDCRYMAHKLNIIYVGYWSDEDIKTLKELFPVMGAEVSRRIEHTERECISMARLMNIKYTNEWTDEYKNILKEYFPSIGKMVYRRLPGKTAIECTNMALELGIEQINKLRKVEWSDADIMMLKNNYMKCGLSVYKLFHDKTKYECARKAHQLGLRCDQKYLVVRKYFIKEGISVYKRVDGMTPSECLKIANELGLLKERRDHVK